MKWVLDTTAFSHLMKRDPALESMIIQYPPKDIVTVPPVVAEIQYGISRLDASSKKALLLCSERDRILSTLNVIAWTDESSQLFGIIKANLEHRGCPIDDFDVAIAAIALSHQCGVITANLEHFNRIAELDVTRW